MVRIYLENGIYSEKNRITAKQKNFVKSLMYRNDMEEQYLNYLALNTDMVLTKHMASKLIDALLDYKDVVIVPHEHRVIL